MKDIEFYEVKSGEGIADVVRAMIVKAQQSKKGVVCRFNEITLAVNPNSKEQEILNFYYSEFSHFARGDKEKSSQEENTRMYKETRTRGC